jgi:hypothetical protein
VPAPDGANASSIRVQLVYGALNEFTWMQKALVSLSSIEVVHSPSMRWDGEILVYPRGGYARAVVFAVAIMRDDRGCIPPVRM